MTNQADQLLEARRHLDDAEIATTSALAHLNPGDGTYEIVVVARSGVRRALERVSGDLARLSGPAPAPK